MSIASKFHILKHVIENEMPANKLLRLEILELKDGYTKIHIPFREEFIGDFLHGSGPKDFYAEAEVIKNGKRIVKVDVKLYHEKDKVIAIARCVFSILRKEN